MGVVNVTPDSFSDGGAWLDPRAAIAHGVELMNQGADIIDVGGESTRPGAQRVPMDEELGRVLPVVTALASAGCYVSIDTMRAEVASRALEAGASMINDVSGGQADPGMAKVVAATGVPYVVMHWRGHSADMYGPAVYTNVVAEVRAELRQRLDTIFAAGVDPAQVILDPGLGFAKHPEHNWKLLASLEAIGHPPGLDREFPVLVAASRKGFLGRLLADQEGHPRSFTGSDEATVALTALAVASGAWCVRVHALPGNLDAVRVATRWLQERRAGAANA
ncbi:MAG TPA: dihydropteroate synthase [Streptosporangiaceae bacterium]